MSWLYSSVLVAELSEGKSLDGLQCVEWKSKNMPMAYSSQDRTTNLYILFRFGPMCERLVSQTPNAQTSLTGSSLSGINWLFREDSLARIYRWLGKAQVLMGKAAAYGENLHGWFAKYDQQKCMWKTAQSSLLGDYTEYLATWPKWGIMLNGVCWPLKTLELTTTGKEFGYMLPGNKETFPTPKTSDHKAACLHGDGGPDLKTYIAQFPTPQSRDYKGAHTNNSQSFLQRYNHSRGVGLPEFLQRIGEHDNKEKVQLNPDWDERLMMWPEGWTRMGSNHIDLQSWISNYSFKAHESIEWEGDTPRVAVNVPNRIKRIKCIGNGQVPFCMAAAYVLLSKLQPDGIH